MKPSLAVTDWFSFCILRPFYISVFLSTLVPFQVLMAQNIDQETQQEIKMLDQLPVTSFLGYLDNNQSKADYYLSNDYLRHAIIQKLDYAVDTIYDFWIDRRSFEAFLTTLSQPAANGNQRMGLVNQAQEKSRYALFFKDSTFTVSNGKPEIKNWRGKKDSLLRESDRDLLFKYLQLDTNLYDPNVVAANIGALKHHTTLQYLSWAYKRHVHKYPYVSDFIKERNFELIKHRVSLVKEQNFVHYKSNEVDVQAIKEVDFYMDNDFFQPLQNLNQDRNYTGGGGLTFATDYFAMRWLNPAWIFRNPDKIRRVVMTYQSVGLNMHFYTPYIRYRNNFDLADTLHRLDRPFASYVYVDRSKYRLWPKGLVRHHGAFQIGQIGADLGRNVQAILHRDATVESQKVYGWDRQIAQGGRWLVQMNHNVDFLLFSTTNRYKSFFAQNAKNESSKYEGINLILNSELLFGGYMSAVGGGVTLSTMDFTKQSGQKMIRPRKNKSAQFGYSAYARAGYRYVIHNSTLEGFGYLKTYRDDAFDDEYESVYTLNQAYYQMFDDNNPGDERQCYPYAPSYLDQVVRNLWMFDIGFQLRWGKGTFYFNWRLLTKEFKDSDTNYLDPYFLSLIQDSVEREYYKRYTVPDLNDYRDRKYYGYGTAGISFLVDN